MICNPWQILRIRVKKERQCTYTHNIQAQSRNHFSCGKANTYFILWLCVCSLKCPACKAHAPYYIVIYSLSGSTKFSTLSHYWYDFLKKLVKIKWVFWFSLPILCQAFLVLTRIKRDVIMNAHRSSCKVPSILTRFSSNLNYRVRFSKKYSNIKSYGNPSSGSRGVPTSFLRRNSPNHNSSFYAIIYRF